MQGTVSRSTYSVSRSDTDTVQLTGVGFDAVIVRMRTGMDFQYGGLQTFFSS